MRKNETIFQVAIDGPVAAGKSTVARLVARKMGFVYVDTGAMYRAVALAVLRKGIEIDDEEAIVRLAKETDIDVRTPRGKEDDGRLSTVLLNGEDVSWEIRGKEVSEVVAKVASLPRVREVLVAKQQMIANKRAVVMEGRDITYVVLPQADLKIFLTASEEVRVKRYFEKMREKNPSLTMKEARRLLKDRDYLDKHRQVSPLKIVKGAWVVDTSEMSIEEVVGMISERIIQMRKNNEQK